MGKALRITLVVIGVLAVAGGLVFAGAWIGRGNFYGMGGPQSSYRMMDTDTTPSSGIDRNTLNDGSSIGPGMMNGYGGRAFDTGPGMMNRGGLGSGTGPGMMGGSGNGYGPGMMNGYDSTNPLATPLTVDQAFQAATTYLAALNIPDLKIAEVMVFDNNAYVRVVEQSTGIGAFELLVNPSTLGVTPEPGPNMMWNLKYSGLNHENMMGGGYGMMGNSLSSSTPAAVSSTMPITANQALQAAQTYLNTALPSTQTASDADPFYGYYTIDILRGGNIIGMLSVNGFNSQVFLHTWHGTFISTQDY
jgi:hypothetical protein